MDVTRIGWVKFSKSINIILLKLEMEPSYYLQGGFLLFSSSSTNSLSNNITCRKLTEVQSLPRCLESQASL